MAFPKKFAAADQAITTDSATTPPAFSKKPAPTRKQRKAAPIQKAMMQAPRSMSGGGR